MRALNNYRTTDQYPNTGSLDCPGTRKVSLLIVNAPVFVQWVYNEAPSSYAWEDELFHLPGWYSRNLSIQRIQVRSAIAGVPALVTIEAAT